MLENDIIKIAQSSPVKIFFDMDGVCAEYGANDRALLLSNAPGFYLNRRPIKSMLTTMERLGQVENVELLILSNCYSQEQKQDKIQWLAINAPFIKRENIYIITLKDETYTKETKDFIKGNYIKKITNGFNGTVALIEDDHRIINATKKILPDVKVNHVSTLIP